VGIAEAPADFVAKSCAALALPASGRSWLDAVDRELTDISWDRTWAQMATLVAEAGHKRGNIRSNSKADYCDQGESPKMVSRIAS
jgi:hypothetical protein